MAAGKDQRGQGIGAGGGRRNCRDAVCASSGRDGNEGLSPGAGTGDRRILSSAGQNLSDQLLRGLLHEPHPSCLLSRFTNVASMTTSNSSPIRKWSEWRGKEEISGSPFSESPGLSIRNGAPSARPASRFVRWRWRGSSAAGFEKRKAIYLPFPQAIPHSLVIDPKTCTRCGECVKACGPGAIDLDEKEETGDDSVPEPSFSDLALSPSWPRGKGNMVSAGMRMSCRASSSRGCSLLRARRRDSRSGFRTGRRWRGLPLSSVSDRGTPPAGRIIVQPSAACMRPNRP